MVRRLVSCTGPISCLIFHPTSFASHRTQYDAAVRQLTKLQSDAREAFEREDAANAELVRTRNELQRALREVQVLSCPVCGISTIKRDVFFFSLCLENVPRPCLCAHRSC